MAAVTPALQKDPVYLLSQAQKLRRAGDLGAALKVMAEAPRDRTALVDPDEWWTERRVLARKLLDAKRPEDAYTLCAEHSASGREHYIEAEFHAGWIALHSGIASGGDVILLPEIAWTFENVCRTVMHRDREGKRYTLIVVAEGAHLPDGGLVHCGESGGRGQVKLGGIGEIVAREIAARLGREVRTVVLGHLQRGGTPTAFDRMLATEFGAHATRLVHEGRFGEMVCYRPPDIASVPIAEAIGRLSTVDPRGSAVQAARALGIGFGDDEDGDPFAGGGGPKPLATT